jgi:hypothetical protein
MITVLGRDIIEVNNTPVLKVEHENTTIIPKQKHSFIKLNATLNIWFRII